MKNEGFSGPVSSVQERSHGAGGPVPDPALKSESRKRETPAAFTLIELLIVITIIGILAALVLNTAGYAQKKAARSRAEVEIKALEAALESYKADMGDYPLGSNGNPNATTAPVSTNYFLRAALCPAGPDTNNAFNPQGKVYFEFPKGMGTNTNVSVATNQSVVDPFGEPYGYCYPGSTNGNGTNFFDLWSRVGSPNTNIWVKNW